MNKFDLLYEEIMTQNYDTENKKEYKSFEEFRQFCKQLDLIAELDANDGAGKYIECSLYFMKETDSENKPVRFDFFNMLDKKYADDNIELVNKLTEYKSKYVVTLDGNADSKKVIWG